MNQIKYAPKKNDNKKPWLLFDAPNRSEYEKWSSEACGICCLKMIGDAYGLTAKISLYQLTMECKQKGGFKELSTLIRISQRLRFRRKYCEQSQC